MITVIHIWQLISVRKRKVQNPPFRGKTKFHLPPSKRVFLAGVKIKSLPWSNIDKDGTFDTTWSASNHSNERITLSTFIKGGLIFMGSPKFLGFFFSKWMRKFDPLKKNEFLGDIFHFSFFFPRHYTNVPTSAYIGYRNVNDINFAKLSWCLSHVKFTRIRILCPRRKAVPKM